MSDLLKKGKFEPINRNFIKDSLTELAGLNKIQERYQKGDMDTLLNELHDSMIGNYLGFELVNVEKHGFDCKLSAEQDVFLESKVASYSSSSWSATFNDTTLEKADAFRQSNVWLALSLWENITTPLCICFGQHKCIGDFLEEGVKKHQSGKVVRSTQSLSMSKLLFEYGFKIPSPALPKSELMIKLNTANASMKKLCTDHIIEYKDFVNINDSFL